MFEASCHCGGVVLKTVNSPETVTSCNCSICHRIGALWGYYTAGEVEIAQDKKGLKYSWGKKNLTFHSCTDCGCTTHYTSVNENGTYRVAINTRMAPLSATKNIPIRYFDGADTWKYINE